MVSEKKIGRPRKEGKDMPLPSEIMWTKHVKVMREGSEQLLAALKKQHPKIISYLLANQRAKKEQDK